MWRNRESVREAKAAVFTKFVAPILLIIGIRLGGYLSLFLANSKKTTATVTSISALNDRCNGNKYRSYECTKFTALINFTTHTNQSITAEISAGKEHGHFKYIDSADYRAGQQVEISYDMRNPSTIFTGSDYMTSLVFGITFLLIGAIGTYFGYFK